MRIAIPGGAGFVGRHAARLFSARGARVVTVDRRRPDRLEPGEEVLEGDLGVPETAGRLASSCGRVDALIWLAAVIRHVGAACPETEADLLLMTRGPLAFLCSLDPVPTSMVYLSSIQVYGVPSRLPIDEKHPTEPFTSYGIAKLCAEHYLRVACEEREVGFTALRPSFIYGPGQHPGNVIPRFLDALRRGEAPVIHGEGKGIRDDIYVEDVVRAAAMAVERRVSGTFNIASGKPHNLLEVAETACRIAGGKLRPRHEGESGGWIDRWYDAGKAARELGFSVETSLEEGLREMWRSGGDP